MLAQTLAWLGIFLECLLLFRGVRSRVLTRFPIFYGYIFFVLLQTLFLLAVQRTTSYALLYWESQALALAIGSLVIFEIYRVGLRRYPGTAKIARNLLFLVFALTIAKVIVNQGNSGTVWGLAGTTAELERNLRIVQACSLSALVVALLLYRIPIGRHLKGILIGYGLFVVSSVIQLSLLSNLGTSFQKVWTYLQPISYLIFLVIWTAALWSPVGEEATEPAELLPHGYSRLAQKTQDDLEKIRLGLGKAVR
jgi:hypothetical protein